MITSKQIVYINEIKTMIKNFQVYIDLNYLKLVLSQTKVLQPLIGFSYSVSFYPAMKNFRIKRDSNL